MERQIFIYRYFDERKLEEIAEIEHCSLGSVKPALHRANYAVRHFLQRFGGMPLESAEFQDSAKYFTPLSAPKAASD